MTSLLARPLVLEVIGDPQPKGSHKAFCRCRRPDCRPYVVDDQPGTLRAWQRAIAAAATMQMRGAPPLERAVAAGVVLRFNRPKSHHGAAGRLLPSAPEHKLTRPDLDKLVRAIFDPLTGLAWVDDSQVAELLETRKEWTSGPPGATITIVEL